MKQRDVFVLLKVRSNMTLRELRKMFSGIKVKEKFGTMWIRKAGVASVETRKGGKR